MAKLDPQVVAHLEWIGFIQPTGLVVSAPALVRAGAILDRRDAEGQRLLRQCTEEREFDSKKWPEPWLPDFRDFATSVLGWSFSANGFAGTDESPIPPELEVSLVAYKEVLRPDLAVREMEPQDGRTPWQLLITVLEPGQDFDQVTAKRGQLEASPRGRMERLLRRTGVSAGLIFNGRALRLISAPHGESSGWMDFRVADMVQTAGRPICTAIRLLLRQSRLLAGSPHQRLTALLDDSRKFQNEVSERLAEQVLHALYEFLRGFQAAHDASRGEVLRAPLAERPDEVYRALLTVILRLVFLLYAEERDMLPKGDGTFLRYYSLGGLYERLREDAALFPDTMDQRYGAWARLLVLFRIIHDGAESGTVRLPKRHGVLFDPDRFKFLEGRTGGGTRQTHERIEPPLVPDGTIYRALEKLLVLDGERISYRALDVEQIGSVYETMMGFRLETATGPSVAIKAPKRHGAPTGINLEALLAESAAKRDKWLKDRTDRRLTDKVKKSTREATTLEDLHAALLPVIDLAASPDLVPRGAMVLQPSEERRRSGSHYTPRELTEPIVRTTLEPILAGLCGGDGRLPRPEQILDLKVCDPAMGSGAFLVETCRQLGDLLVEAWHAHDSVPEIPADEDEMIFARRQIAQRCLYGVDRNPVAVDLSKVSLWLVTLAKDHALTFVDHALRHGDSLVGLSRKQIEAFHWDPIAQTYSSERSDRLRAQVAKVLELRCRIREADESVSDQDLRDLWDEAQFELEKVQLYGDLALAAFFDGGSSKERERKRSEFVTAVESGEAERYHCWLEEWRYAEQPLAPFHWEIEFPEVVERENPGFDTIVGNPPFLGGTRISNVLGMNYFQWLKLSYPPAGHLCDMVAYFFRRAFASLRAGGTLGFVATNTVAQGDTRNGGLAHICIHEHGTIYATKRRYRWPGSVSVVVSVVHMIKGTFDGLRLLDGKLVEQITAFLFHSGGHRDPRRLAGKNILFSAGSKIYGQGFLFDDHDDSASPLSEMHRVLEANPAATTRIRPYLGGNELNQSPEQSHYRYVIYLSDIVDEDNLEEWPELAEIVRRKVKPGRDALGSNPNNVPLKRRWWAFQAHRPRLYAAMETLNRVLVCSQVTPHLAFAFRPNTLVFSQKLNVFLLSEDSHFATLQSRAHEVWARFFSSTSMDLLSYTPSDCFETFPCPEGCETHPSLRSAGKAYYDFRAALMVENDEGLTKTYNRFHDPDERDPGIMKLRELHTVMDSAVLEAYGWRDIPTDCDFLLDYEIDEEEWGNKRKPWRYRWPDEVRDEVLARLLELNAERAKEEGRSGAPVTKKGSRKASAKRARKESHTGDLFS